MSDLLKDILEVLRSSGPLKAKRIALALDPTRTHITRSEINSTLYKAKGLKGLSKNNEDIWSYEVESVTKIAFNCSGSWLEASNMESFLKSYPNLLLSDNEIEFDFSNKSLFLDCILKILSLINQLVEVGVRVTIKFSKNSGGFTYLQRCGFFDNLDEKVQILPFRPEYSLAKHYQANSKNLFEIFPIGKKLDRQLISDISDIIEAKLTKEQSEGLLIKIMTFISELVENISQHGFSNIDGYIALQVYEQKKIVISISDSGAGLINTLRKEALPRYSNLELNKLNEESIDNDVQLIGYVFNNGEISRKNDPGRGLGLYRSNGALKKISLNEDIHVSLAVRQKNYEFIFPFKTNGLAIERCNVRKNLSFIRGTHYVITIKT